MTEILLTIESSIATITLNRPEKFNALAGDMREQLLSAIRTVRDDEAARVLIITGAGKAFCAGGDVLAMYQTQQENQVDRISSWLELGGDIVQSLRHLPKPVIAAVNGVAAGAGCNLALACDVRFASEKASFCQAFVRLGLHPDWGGSFFLPQLIGTARAAELMFTGDVVDAQTAQTLGLVNRVVSPDELLPQVTEFARRLTTFSAESLAEIKESLYSVTSLAEAVRRERDVQLKLWASESSRARISDFVERRKVK
ncbi:MAG TPA: enoyl-CoA hydratase-related protein [Acidobacteriota bacterium]|nr:enoyl-CoA hydratase-related protein [Acidobacteriota bacterium]